MNVPLRERVGLAWDILRGRGVVELGIGKALRAAILRAAQQPSGHTASQSVPLHQGGVATITASTKRQCSAEHVLPVRGSGEAESHFTLGDYYVHLISIIDHGKGRSVLYRRAHDPKGTVRRMGLRAWSKKAKPA